MRPIAEYDHEGELCGYIDDPTREVLVKSALNISQDLRAKISGIIGLSQSKIFDTASRDQKESENKGPSVGSQLVTSQKNLSAVLELAQYYADEDERYEARSLMNISRDINSILDQTIRTINAFGVANIEVPPHLIINLQTSPNKPSGGSGGGATVFQLHRD